MRIFVTGANGFIGSRMCAYLVEHGHQVKRSVHTHDGLPDTVEISEKTSVQEMTEAMAGVDCVVHLAAAVHDVHMADERLDREYREVNVVLAQRLADAACAAGVRRFVFLSSIKVCGERSAGRGLREEDAGHPNGTYAQSKWMAEEELRRIERETGLEVVIVRPPLVYGPGVKANFHLLLAAVHAGIPLPFAWLKNRRSLLYLENLVSALGLCITHPKAAGQSFHVSDAKSVTMAELISQLALSMGKSPRILPCPPILLKVLAFVVGRYRQIERLINELEVDAQKIQSLLGWSPGWSLEQGIQETVLWYSWHERPSVQQLDLIRQADGLSVCQVCAVDFTLQHLLRPLIDGMRAKGWQVTSVCADGPYTREIRRRGYRLISVPFSRDFLNLWAHLKVILAIYKLCRTERFDVLHVHTPIAALLGRIAGRMARVPLIVYTAHGFYFHEEMPWWQYRFYVQLERWAGRFMDHLFTQSNEDARTAVEERIAPTEAVTPIGNGVAVNLFCPDRNEGANMRTSLGLPKDAFVIGVIARLVKEKGLVEFLEAAAGLGMRYPHVYFLLVGERLSSDHNASVENELERAKAILGSRLLATGYRADVAALLGAMNLFCLPSYREGMPRSIIEAMMMALPVVATNIRGAREEVVPGETGLLVPTRDAAALARAMETFIVNPALGRQMGLAGRQRALKLYDERRVVERQVEIIAALCKNNSRISRAQPGNTADASD